MESLHLTATDKKGRYEELLPQVEALVSTETDLIANLANVSAALKEAFGWWWVGFYLVRDEQGQSPRLVLGPFQGPLACTSIAYGRGVCGTAWMQAKTQVVPAVEAFPGHIACSSASKSEIVVPLFVGNTVIGVLDADSEFLATFDAIDAEYLEKLVAVICKFIK